MQIEEGSILRGKITGIAAFGAFVELEGGKTGLVHISEIAYSYVNEVSDFLKEGQEVKVKIIGVDENGRINLSIKKAQPQERPAPRPVRSAGGYAPRGAGGNAAPRPAANQGERTFARAPQSVNPPSADQSFEDKLKQFLSSSEGKMADLNRNIDGKRGGGRRRR